MQNFWEAGYEREVGQGITLADAAKAQGVKHFVYSSVGSSYRETGIPAFDGKWEIEEYIRGMRERFDENGDLTDEQTRERMRRFLGALVEWIERFKSPASAAYDRST